MQIKINIFNKIIGCLLLLGAFVFSLICSSDSFAATPTLTLSLSGNSVAMNIVATDSNGSFASSNDLDISVNTNNYSGYTLSISSSANDAVLTGPLNPTTSTNEVLNSVGTVSGVTVAGVSASDYGDSSNTQYNNTWGYKPSKRNSADNSNFLPAPSTSGDVIDATSAANSNNTPNDYTLSIGARVAPSTAVGTYSNTFVVTAVTNLVIYLVSYDANDGNSGQDTSNMPTMQFGRVDPSTSTISISNNVPVRSGFTFNNWCTNRVAAEAACSGTVYHPGDTYTIDFLNSNYLYLYAMWDYVVTPDPEPSPTQCNPSGTTISTILCMQDVSTSNKSSILSSMVQNQQYQLYDSRDGVLYYVAKLADGNIWMTQNLDHNIGNIIGRTYTSSDTDIPSGTTWTPSLNEYTYKTNRTSWHWNDDGPAESYDIGDICWDGTLTPMSQLPGSYTQYTVACNSSNRHYHFGNYYNWAAALATSDTSSYQVNYTDANRSICPAGWRLPTLSGDKSFSNMVSTLGIVSGVSGVSTIQNAPAYLTYTGIWIGESSEVTRRGFYWHSTYYNHDYNMVREYSYDTNGYMSSGQADPGHGFNLRCVVKN